MVFLRFAALPFNTLFLFPFFRCARPRGGGRRFRLPLPRSGLPLPKFSARGAARLKIWTAAPAPPRLFLPQAAPRLRSLWTPYPP